MMFGAKWREVKRRTGNSELGQRTVRSQVRRERVGYREQVRFLGREDPLEEGMATHSSILAQRIPRTEGPGGLYYTGSQRV